MRPQVVQPNPRGIPPAGEPDFSLVIGGPLHQLYLGTRLARSPLDLVGRRMVVIALICWLPLLLLTILAGQFTSGVAVPFGRDPEVHIKLLLAVPMLIGAEKLVHERIRIVVQQFLHRNIIAKEDQSRFGKLIDSSMHIRNSAFIEIGLLALVIGVGFWMWRENLSLTVSSVKLSSWYAVNDGSRSHLTLAGKYYAFVSLSVFRFLLLRWYFRLLIWYRFLWDVRGLPLQLNLYHPDRAGGLGFLSISLVAFSPVFVAQTTALAGVIYTRILYAGERITDFKVEIAGALLFCMLVVTLPLSFFIIILERAGRIAKGEFGVLSSRYVDDFRNKWVKGNIPPDEQLLGTPDMQSLADLGNAFTSVNGMNIIPVTIRTLMRLLLAIAAPLAPLILTAIPLHEIVMRLFKMIF